MKKKEPIEDDTVINVDDEEVHHKWTQTKNQ